MRRQVVLRAMAMAMAVMPACSGTPYFYGPLGQVVAQPKPSGCTFAVLDKSPAEAYDPLGVLAPADIGAAKLPSDEAGFRKAAAAQICAAGGDAVVVERNGDGRNVRATVIRWR